MKRFTLRQVLLTLAILIIQLGMPNPSFGDSNCEKLNAAIEEWRQESQGVVSRSDKYGNLCKSQTTPMGAAVSCGAAMGMLNKADMPLRKWIIGKVFLEQGKCDVNAVEKEYLDREEKVQDCMKQRQMEMEKERRQQSPFAASRFPTMADFTLRRDCQDAIYKDLECFGLSPELGRIIHCP